MVYVRTLEIVNNEQLKLQSFNNTTFYLLYVLLICYVYYLVSILFYYILVPLLVTNKWSIFNKNNNIFTNNSLSRR